MERILITRDAKVADMMDVIEKEIIRKKSAKRDDNRRMFFNVSTVDKLVGLEGEVFTELEVRASEKPLSLREIAEFVVDNTGKVDKIKVDLAN